MSPEQEAARQRLIQVIPHLKLAMSMVEIQLPGCKAELGIIGREPDGGGKVTASFEGDTFIQDLILLVDDPELSTIFQRPKKSHGK